MKKYILLLITASLAIPAVAQEERTPTQFPRHEISIYGTLGQLSLVGRYNNVIPSAKTFDQLDGGVGYTFFFHPQWGITTGAEVAFFSAGMHKPRLKGSTLKTYSYAGVTEPMYFNSEWENYEETLHATYIQVPLLIQFQTAGYHKFCMALGGKVGLAVAGDYKTTATSLTTSGYLPEIGQTFSVMPNHGFTTIRKPAHTGAVDFGLNISATAEIGVRWTMGKRVALYTGVYLDCGLLDVAPEKTKAGLVNYPPVAPGKFTYNSVLTAQKSPDGGVYADEVILASLGIKMRLAFNW